jgi:hypothetical protein
MAAVPAGLHSNPAGFALRCRQPLGRAIQETNLCRNANGVGSVSPIASAAWRAVAAFTGGSLQSPFSEQLARSARVSGIILGFGQLSRSGCRSTRRPHDRRQIEIDANAVRSATSRGSNGSVVPMRLVT